MPKFVLPDPGEGLVEAEIVTWKVKAGDHVKTNDIVVEVETAKSLVELPIPYDGVVTALLVAEGDVVEVGNAIIDIDDGSGGGGDAASGDAASGEAVSGKAARGEPGKGASETGVDQQGEDVGEGAGLADDLVPAIADDKPGEASGDPESAREPNLVGYGPSVGATTRRRRKGGHAPADSEADTHASKPRPKSKPPVRKYAKDRGVDIATVQPSGDDGVISRADIDRHLQGGGGPPVAGAPVPAQTTTGATARPAATAQGLVSADSPSTGSESSTTARDTSYTPPVFERSGPRETRTPVKGVRKMTAKAMVDSAFSAPHVSEFITVDVSATMDLVERLKGEREFRDLKVSPLLVLAKALTVAIKRHPGVNAAWDGDAGEIVQRHYVNLGIAAATPRGLMVPNIKDADLMDMRQLAEAMIDLIATARAGRTQPAQMSGGTITITNVGVFGVDTGTPIINPGESMIVCFGAVRRQPWVMTDADGTEHIEPRWMTQLAASFDHRLIDGELGSRFLADLAALLHDPSRALVWG
ncbi:MAG: dihydrolipoamide acetyltransferase family protein [Ornithinimicrobium sp.]